MFLPLSTNKFFTCVRAVTFVNTFVNTRGLGCGVAEIWDGLELGWGLSETKMWDDHASKKQNQLRREFKCSPWLPQERITTIMVLVY